MSGAWATPASERHWQVGKGRLSGPGPRALTECNKSLEVELDSSRAGSKLWVHIRGAQPVSLPQLERAGPVTNLS